LKRFYTDVHVVDAEGEFAIHLGNKPIKTPLKTQILAPTQALGEALAEEWRGQGEKIDLKAMPMTRLLTTSIDRVGRERAAVEAIISDYARSDLLCYRAERGELATQQANAWDPVLAWALKTHDLQFVVTVGVMPVDQPEETVRKAAALLTLMSECHLAGFGQIAHILDSVLLAHALAGGQLDVDAAWRASRIDEDWQAEQWGRDAEAEVRHANLRRELEEAVRFLTLSKMPVT